MATKEQNLNSGNVAGKPQGKSEEIKLRDTQDVALDWMRKNQITNSQGNKNSDASDIKFIGNQIAQGISALSPTFTAMNTEGNPVALKLRDSVSDIAIKSGNPIAMAIGAATKVIDAVGDATGYHLDDIDKSSGDRAGVSGFQRFVNNAATSLPGLGTLMAFGSPETDQAASLNEYGEQAIGSYSGTQRDIHAAKMLSGKRTVFGIGRNKMNNFINSTNQDTDILNEIGKTNSLAKRSDYGTNIAQQNLNRYAGTNYQGYTVGRNGMKIMSRKELQNILATRKLQNGGVIGTDTNIIPDGALHARLNHLDETNPELEDVTRKGIPVLDENGEQIAEIEHSELILRLELTKKIEELMEDGSEEAMIEAGKILTKELLENTQDNKGLLTEEVENGK